MKKKVIAILLLVALTLNATYTYATEVQKKLFTDIPEEHWAIPNIQELVDMGVINGFPDGSFKPNFSVNVDAFIKMTIVALGYESIENGSPYWAQPFIDKAMELGIIEENQFASYTQAITREEMSSIIAKAIKDEDKADTRNFVENYVNDFSSISYTYVEDVKDAYAFGIITGMPDDTFRPQDESTRAQASTIIHRMVDQKERKPFEPIEPPTGDIGQGGSGSGSGSNDSGASGEEPMPVEHIHRVEDGKVVYSTEKIMEILKGYPVIENEYSNDFIENNYKFTDQASERTNYSHLSKETMECLKTLFIRDYKTIDKESYSKTLLYWIKAWWYYRNTDYKPEEFAKLWADETEKWQIQQDIVFVTDSYRSIYGTNNGKAVRGRMYIKYNNHDNIDNILYEMDLSIDNLELKKWYYIDVDVEMFRPMTNLEISWKTSKYMLYSLHYLSNVKLVEGQ